MNAVNGTIVLDKSKSGKDDEHGKTHLSSMMKAMENISLQECFRNVTKYCKCFKSFFQRIFGAKPGCHGMKHHENEDGHKK